MDRNLRRLHQQLDPNSFRYLMACARAGYIPPQAPLQLDQLPELAKHPDIRQVVISKLSLEELDLVNSANISDINSLSLHQLAVQYILNSDNWTIYGYSKNKLPPYLSKG